jgi:hypothetical protein
MGTRRGRQRQEDLWVATAALARPASHPFYERLNRILEECGFDEFVEKICQPFYADRLGRPSITPGMYFRMLMVGYFEGSIASAELRGELQTRSASGPFCGLRWMNPCQIRRRSRGHGG